MKKHKILTSICTYTFSFIFGCILILMNHINFDANIFPKQFINSFNFNFYFFIKAFLISVPIYIFIYLIFNILEHIKIKNNQNYNNINLIYIITFLGIFISGLIFLITYYPGSGMTDTFDILTTPIGVAHKHPLFYNLAITVPYRVFNQLFNNMNLSFFLVGLLQLIFIDLVITFMIGWLYKTIKSKIATIILMVYFIFNPIIVNYNTAIVKDSIFSVMLLLMIPIIYSIIISKGNWMKSKKNILMMTIDLLLVTLVRNNGLLVVLFVLIMLCLTYPKNFKCFGIILLIVIIINKSVGFIPGIKDSLFQEKVGVPIQQLAYVIYTNGSIKENDKEYLSNVFEIDAFKEKYHPYYVDMIKWDNNFNREYLNKTSSKFLKVWFNTLPNNFEAYVKSYLLTTYGSWAPDNFENLQSRFLGFSDFEISNFTDFKDIEHQRIWPSTIQNTLESFYYNTTKYLSAGICIWITIIIGLFLIYKRNYSHLLLITPIVAIWGTLMIATPLSTAFRYMVPFIYVMPFVLFIVLNLNKKL